MFYWFKTLLPDAPELFLCTSAWIEYRHLFIWWNASVCLPQVCTEATDCLGGVNSQQCNCLCLETSYFFPPPALRSCPFSAVSDSVLLSGRAWSLLIVTPSAGRRSIDWALCLSSYSSQEPFPGAPFHSQADFSPFLCHCEMVTLLFTGPSFGLLLGWGCLVHTCHLRWSL